MTPWLPCVLAAYLVGSIPFGVLIGRARGVDIREHGSRNIGATNVGRVLGRRLGGLCFALDLGKGAGPVIAAGLVTGVFGRSPGALTATEMWWWLAVAAAAVVGHMASVFLGLRGGKGVATSFGALLAMWPLLTFPALGALLVWYAVVRGTRIVSLASMAAAASLPLLYGVRLLAFGEGELGPRLVHGAPPAIVTALLALLVVWRHRANLARIRRGEEPRLGEKTDSA